jgi:predicted RNA-binding Zn-ribbon protein involved in translation (DUF1610 family)
MFEPNPWPPREVRVNEAGFDFDCPRCGLAVGNTSVVYSLPLSVGWWPVCEACGMDWCAEYGIRDPGLPGR